MANSNDDNDDRDDAKAFAEVISSVLAHTVNEPIIIQRMEKYFSPRPANIFNSDEEGEDLRRYIDEFVSKFGGREPRLIITTDETDPRKEWVRTYPIDICNELIASFHVCHSAVCRLHMFYIGLESVRKRPEWIINMTEEESRVYTRVLSSIFWDNLEIATIRLASYWDRVGQLLDFVFFNIRQYERDGFPAVLQRIKKNFVPTSLEVGNDPNWKTLFEYANSERLSGFQWLARRRNLTVHSTRLHPYENGRDALFEYEFNHYEARVIRDLALKSPEEELKVIHLHLAKAAELFRGVFDFARLGLDIIAQDVISHRR